MELHHLKAFVAVAELGSITRAAEALHASQPALSAHVKALEDDLGVELFRRTARGMTLTGAGEGLLPHARQTLANAARMLREAQRLAGRTTGTLSIGVVHCGLDLKLPAISERLVGHHRETALQIINGNSNAHERSILDDRLDVAMVEGDFDDERLAVTRIGTSRLVIIGPGSWETDLSGAGWARLSEFPWVFQSPDCSYARLMDRLCRTHGLSLSRQYMADHYAAMGGLVSQGLAMSLADADEVSALIESGEVFVWGSFEYAMPVQVIALKARSKEPLIRGFVEASRAVHRPVTRRKAKSSADTT
jgi:DNA-binding transcriptional LysR family regulator